MFGKCENCGLVNYLTPFKFTENLTKNVCLECFKMFANSKEEGKLQEVKCGLKAELRKAFGKMGEF